MTALLFASNLEAREPEQFIFPGACFQEINYFFIQLIAQTEMNTFSWQWRALRSGVPIQGDSEDDDGSSYEKKPTIFFIFLEELGAASDLCCIALATLYNINGGEKADERSRTTDDAIAITHHLRVIIAYPFEEELLLSKDGDDDGQGFPVSPVHPIFRPSCIFWQRCCKNLK